MAGTCFTGASLQPNLAQLEAIKVCQQIAQSPYCYPPNNTRICVPSEDVPFYWPPTYYHSDSIISLEWDLDSLFTFFKNNTGNRTDSFTHFRYRSADPAPGLPDARQQPMYFLERRTAPEIADHDLLNYEVHEGPTLILVKTAEFTTSSARYRPTSWLGSPKDDDSDETDKKPQLDRALKTVIIVIAVIIGVLFSLCFLGRCCSKAEKERMQRKRERALRQTEENRDRHSSERSGVAEDGTSASAPASAPAVPPFVLSGPGGRGDGVVLAPDRGEMGGPGVGNMERGDAGDDGVAVPPPPYSREGESPPKYKP